MVLGALGTWALGKGADKFLATAADVATTRRSKTALPKDKARQLMECVFEEHGERLGLGKSAVRKWARHDALKLQLDEYFATGSLDPVAMGSAFDAVLAPDGAGPYRSGLVDAVARHLITVLEGDDLQRFLARLQLSDSSIGPRLVSNLVLPPRAGEDLSGKRGEAIAMLSKNLRYELRDDRGSADAFSAHDAARVPRPPGLRELARDLRDESDWLIERTTSNPTSPLDADTRSRLRELGDEAVALSKRVRTRHDTKVELLCRAVTCRALAGDQDGAVEALESASAVVQERSLRTLRAGVARAALLAGRPEAVTDLLDGPSGLDEISVALEAAILAGDAERVHAVAGQLRDQLAEDWTTLQAAMNAGTAEPNEDLEREVRALGQAERLLELYEVLPFERISS
jgi:hypothetical protein